METRKRFSVSRKKWKHTFEDCYTCSDLKSVRSMRKSVIGWTWSKQGLSKPLLGANTLSRHSSQDVSMVFQAMHTVISLLHHGQNFQWSSNHLHDYDLWYSSYKHIYIWYRSILILSGLSKAWKVWKFKKFKKLWEIPGMQLYILYCSHSKQADILQAS